MLVLAIAAVGCANERVASQDGNPAAPSALQTPPLTATPTFETASRLGLIRRSGTVRVGMNQDDAFSIFTQPPNSYEKSDLPASFDASSYEATGWQSKGEGFGMILCKGKVFKGEVYKDKVVVAVDELDGLTEARLASDVVKPYIDAFGQPQYFDDKNELKSGFLDGRFVRYWFWQSGSNTGDILMICATEVKMDKLNVTIAVGWDSAMATLRMTPASALEDQRSADRLIDRQRSANKPNGANSSNRGGS
ncbi:MAG TPA: hypothetical protein VHE55_12480 [Fimbriimonadaceae bacterium]|nr:hypothetical protein [Fimbriimonadaceae bacterium]